MSLAPELSPTLLEKYQILGEISRGGMGVVFKALHKEMGKLVAIKVILGQLPDLKDIQRFEREALALAQLRHPNIVRVMEFSGFSAHSKAYMVMEYVEGITFDRWVNDSIRKTGAVPPLEESAPLLETLASALSYCHSRGIAHRDLKPVNIVIESGTQRPVLLDFGLVKADAKLSGSNMGELGSPLTATGEILGTPAFMAPEQIESTGRFGRLGLPCDVWGLGGLLYFAVTGRPPHRGE
ncbi:MAG: serine/threonine-protein kinase, partial [Planctomycetota bacterium]|nr:serine/threonine-protein kinase [Planctomycetota bacterium]